MSTSGVKGRTRQLIIHFSNKKPTLMRRAPNLVLCCIASTILVQVCSQWLQRLAQTLRAYD